MINYKSRYAFRKKLPSYNQIVVKAISYNLNIEVPMHSRIEHRSRQTKREQVHLLPDILNIEQEELLTLWIINKLTKVIGEYKDIASKALKK